MARVKKLSTRANFAWTALGRASYGACQWAILVVLAKLGSLAMLGRFSLALAVTAPVMVFLNLHLRNLYATDSGSRFPFATYQRLRNRLTTLGLILCIGIATFGEFPLWTRLAIVAMAAAKAIESLQDLHYGVFQRFGGMDSYGRSLFLRGSLGLLALAALVYTTGRVTWGLAGMAGAWAVVLVFVDRPNAGRIRRMRTTAVPNVSHETLTLARLAAPLGIVHLLDSLNANIPRYFLDYRLNADALGIFVPMTYLFTIGSAFVFALGAPLAPRLAEYYRAGDRLGYRDLALKLLALAAAMGIAGVVFAWLLGPWFLALAYTEAHAAHGTAFIWVMGAGGLHYIMVISQYNLIAARALGVQSILYLLTTVVTTWASWIWIGQRGVEGAAQGMTLGLALGVAATMAVSVRVWSTMSRST
ncbi:MAG: lipopolysaccharide biosynthesis protein [Nannocystaceae bacterium]